MYKIPRASLIQFAACAVTFLSGAPAILAQQSQGPTPYQFDFGSGETPSGSTRVLPDAVYSDEKGYGFDLGSTANSKPPFFFSIKVPEGNYRVTVTLGDENQASSTTLRSEAGHLMASGIETAPGKFETRVFIANVRRPQLPAPPLNAPGSTIVHMFLPGEAESRAWDDRLTIEFNGSQPRVHSLEIVRDDKVPTLFVAGDSTVGDPRHGPAGNWPTQMCQFFKPEIAVCNSAEGGETSKSFITGQRMDKVLSQMKAGDFFLIQFGHNDQKSQWPQSYTDPETTYKAYLKVFIAETRRRGATLVLVTPMERRANGDSVGAYARAMREVAKEENVPLVDQWAMSKELWTALGPNVKSAFNDQTHLNGYGGYLLSKVVVAGIKANVPGLAKFIVDDFKEMDLAHPEAPPAYLKESPGPVPPPRTKVPATPAPATRD